MSGRAPGRLRALQPFTQKTHRDSTVAGTSGFLGDVLGLVRVGRLEPREQGVGSRPLHAQAPGGYGGLCSGRGQLDTRVGPWFGESSKSWGHSLACKMRIMMETPFPGVVVKQEVTDTARAGGSGFSWDSLLTGCY